MGRASRRKTDPAHRAEMDARNVRRLKRSVRSRKAAAMARKAARVVPQSTSKSPEG